MTIWLRGLISESWPKVFSLFTLSISSEHSGYSWCGNSRGRFWNQSTELHVIHRKDSPWVINVFIPIMTINIDYRHMIIDMYVITWQSFREFVRIMTGINFLNKHSLITLLLKWLILRRFLNPVFIPFFWCKSFRIIKYNKLRWVLLSEHLWHRFPPKFTCWNPTAWGDDIRSWHLWELIGLWGRSPQDEISGLIKEAWKGSLYLPQVRIQELSSLQLEEDPHLTVLVTL